MKKTSILMFVSLSLCMQMFAQWAPQGDKIKTPWAEQVNPKNVLPEYPRPQLERKEWENLNGEWNYAIRPKGESIPSKFEGKILVPFAVESSLSGVQKHVKENQELWYEREFSIPSKWGNKQVKLNFGAVDWKADVYVNGIMIGSHTGGFTPFSFDITPYLTGKTNQKVAVCVWDPTDRGYQPRGKQVSNPQGIWYTPVTGIWQTVWIEPVNTAHITHIRAIPNIDNKLMAVTVNADNARGDVVQVDLLENGKTIASGKGIPGEEIRLQVSDMKLWSVESPYLYDMKVKLLANGKVADEVDSYTAFRKISYQADKNGIQRMYLNNKPLFHFGPLDQGWYPDGLYTAATEEAMVYDLKKTQDFGFNMIRKHVKVEPARWYYNCDKMGILVWQDMPSGDLGNKWENQTYNGGTDKKRSAESAANFDREWKEIMDLCISNPSVVVWVPYNEAWGQYQTERVSDWTKNYDPSRLVNPASGGNFRACGDILDLHNYPGPAMYLFDPQRVNVLGEYGGIGLPLPGHLWRENQNWGYVQFKNSNEVTAEYIKYAEELINFVKRGFSAAVYTQISDVEGEVNGLLTYDRKKIKVNEADVRDINRKVIAAMSED